MIAVTSLYDWLLTHPLSAAEVDCTTAVMLKILDGKCKMAEAEKRVMAQLYAAVKHRVGECLDTEIHALIARSLGDIDEEVKLFIYEKRVLAETMISRPVMKAFKARIRNEGLFTLLGSKRDAATLGKNKKTTIGDQVL